MPRDDEGAVTLQEFIHRKRSDFAAKLGKTFTERKRASDFRILFVAACRRRYPHLNILWLQKHHALATTLLETYEPKHLLSMIELYVTTEKYRLGRGLSVEGFYYACPTIATDLAEKDRVERVVAERKQALAAADAKREEEERVGLLAFMHESDGTDKGHETKALPGPHEIPPR